MTASTPASQRPICPACARPLRACLCACVREVRTEIELLVLQHPLEAQQAKGTVALLQRCVPRCTVLVGERFEPPEGLQDRHTLLLYPPTEQGPAAAPLEAERLADLARLRLVLIDATWRKSLKLLLHNRWLQQLPRLSLQDLAPSRYAIRRAHAPHQLSTLEAAAAALAQLGEAPATVATLFEAMDAFIRLQQGFGPARPAPSQVPERTDQA